MVDRAGALDSVNIVAMGDFFRRLTDSLTDTLAEPADQDTPPPVRREVPERISKILVTGGAGFIGANFVHRTLKLREDVQIVVLDALTYAGNTANLRNVPGGCDGLGGVKIPGGSFTWSDNHRCQLVVGDICDEELVDRLVSHVDLVVHCAAETHNDNSLTNPTPFLRTNVEGTSVVASACVRWNVAMHHISTDEVFGDLPVESDERFTEASQYCPSSPYSASKASSDHIVQAWVRSFGLRGTISNCSNNYGPYQHPEKFIPRQIIGLLNDRAPRLYGTGENVRDWIHVNDHTDAVWAIIDHAWEHGTYGEHYLIGADGERSNLQVAEDILAAFGRPAEDIVFVTDRPGHDRRYAIDASKLRREVGWEPTYTNFAQGIAELAEWYRKHKSWWEDTYRAAEERYAKHEQVLDTPVEDAPEGARGELIDDTTDSPTDSSTHDFTDGSNDDFTEPDAPANPEKA